jgi:hypothetical protein
MVVFFGLSNLTGTSSSRRNTVVDCQWSLRVPGRVVSDNGRLDHDQGSRFSHRLGHCGKLAGAPYKNHLPIMSKIESNH